MSRSLEPSRDRVADPGTHRRSPLGLALVAALLLGLTVAGWWHLWFLTDDAYIAFRYVSNAMADRGLVWNPPPFAPVEGYTCFLWAIVLWATWAWLGIEPPAAANTLSLLFSLATLGLGWRTLSRMRLPERTLRHRAVIAAVALIGTATNRVFLTWASSGLETALFAFTVTLWVSFAVVPAAERTRGNVFGLTTATLLVCLTRPDGLLFFLAALALLIVERRVRLREIALSPLLLVPAHFLWRHSFYGLWLPNTYYAKYTEPMPEAGWRYLACFALEYGVWVWFVLVLAWAAREVLGRARRIGAAFTANPGAFAAVGVLLLHAAYYILVIGGDHFEYRVFAHLPLLLFVSAAFLAARVTRRATPTVVLLVVFVVASWPLAWMPHEREQPLAPRFPAVLRPIVSAYDTWQEELFARLICIRHGVLRHVHDVQVAAHPSREEGAAIAWDDRPVLAFASVGHMGWVLPNVAIIDTLGLNDRVVARCVRPMQAGQGEVIRAVFRTGDTDGDKMLTSTELAALLRASGLRDSGADPGAEAQARWLIAWFDTDDDGELTAVEAREHANMFDHRQMAHDRVPPPGYVDGFRANVRIDDRRVIVTPRDERLTDAEIVAHEAEYWARVR